MIVVLDLEFTDRIDQAGCLSAGHLAADGGARKRFAGVIDSAPGDAASA